MERMKKIFVLMTLTFLALHVFVSNLNIAMAASMGDVVINEIAWAGTTDSYNDEWIELYNTTNQTIDLSGFIIEDDGSTTYEISSGSIAPHGYFVIEDDEETISTLAADALIGLSLANAGDSLVLKDASGNTIDTVNGSGGAWYAGDSSSKATMERVDPYSTTDEAANWADASSGNGAQGSTGLDILGTPGGANSNFSGTGPQVSLMPSSAFVSNGDQVTFTAEVDSVTDLYSYGFEISYDPTMLTYISASEGNFLKADGTPTAFNAALEDGTEGKLIVGNARLLSPPDGIDGSGALFEVDFGVVGADNTSGMVSFTGSNFMSDSVGDLLFSSSGASVTVGSGGGGSVTNLAAALGAERYSLELSWSDGNASDSYSIYRKGADGANVLLGSVTEMAYTDSSNLVPGVVYEYEVVAVKNGIASAGVQVSGLDNRGLTGDLDRSDRVDGRDIEKLARSYGSSAGDEEYDPLNDTNYDGIIDGSDLIDVGSSFGLIYQ